MKRHITLTLIVITTTLLIIFTACSSNNNKKNTNHEQSAVEFINMLRNEEYGKARLEFEQRMKSAYSENELKDLWESITTTYGQIDKIEDTYTEEITQNKEIYTVVYVVCSYKTEDENKYFILRVVYDKKRRIAGFWHQPTTKEEVEKGAQTRYSTPNYVNLGSFYEEEIELKVDSCTIKGILTLPKDNTDNKYPVAILVHGSGPNDMDESVGKNKPFKDIAQGLASVGIATLRYDKRTYACKILVEKSIGTFTIDDETVNDAVSYAEILSTHKKIDENKIILIGHSLGGTMIPRIAQKSEHIKALISMAGSNSNILDEIVRQTEYLINLDGSVSNEEQAYLQQTIDTCNKVKNNKIEDGEIILGASKTYWENFLSYNPIETAKSVIIPMLFLQGERDYQVTMNDFNRWKEALSDKLNTSFVSYKNLNHMFMEGEGKPTPEEYMKTSNVAEEVIRDMVKWIEEL